MSRSPDSAETDSPDIRRHGAPVYRSILLPSPTPEEREEAACVPKAPKSDDALADAMAPVVRENLIRELRENPNIVIDIVYPVLGRVIRKSIAESLKSLMAAIENSAKSAFSMKRLRWRWEAWRTGRPYAQVVLGHSLVFRVEEVLLIHRRTGLLALHESVDPVNYQDRELVSGMLTAVEDLARDSYNLEAGAGLNSFAVGDLQLLLKASPHALLVGAVRGTPSQAVHDQLADTLDTIHERYLRYLESFDGDSSKLEQLRPVLRDCLMTQTTE